MLSGKSCPDWRRREPPIWIVGDERPKKLNVKVSTCPRVEATSLRVRSSCCRQFLVSLGDSKSLGAPGIFSWAEERQAVDS